jgi:hypothetical protein
VKVVPRSSWRAPGDLTIYHITLQSSCSSRTAMWRGPTRRYVRGAGDPPFGKGAAPGWGSSRRRSPHGLGQGRTSDAKPSSIRMRRRSRK